MLPKIPQYGKLRLATLKDIPRIGIVAAAAFYHSPVFHFERPDYKDYPYDTVASYRASFTEAILDKDAVVIVAEDTPEKTEVDDVYEELKVMYRKDEALNQGKAEDTVIVGVASMSFLPDSDRSGQFLPEGPNPKKPEKDSQDQKRDQDKEGLKLYKQYSAKPKAKHFAGRELCDMMVVHPTYWRRHHGTDLAKWINDVSDVDEIGLGVSAAKMGTKLFESVGYTLAELVEVKGYDKHADSIFLWLGQRNATSRTLRSDL